METQVLEVLNKKGLGPMIDALRLTRFTDLLLALLDAITRIWRVCEWHNEGPKFVGEFECHNGKGKLERLTRIPGEVEVKACVLFDLYEKQMEVLDQEDEGIFDENVVPLKRLDYGGTPGHKSNHFEQHDYSRSFGTPNRGGFHT